MIMTPEQASELLIAAIMAIIAGGLQAPIVEPLTNLFKWIATKFNVKVNPNLILFLIGTAVTVGTWLSRRFGFEVPFEATQQWLTTVVPIVVTLLATLFGSKAIYNQAVKREVPLFGYSKTPEQTDMSSDTVIESTMKQYPASVAKIVNAPSVGSEHG